jgi:hypothetical protein
LFAPGGRWTIKEIVDLETVYNYVFDAWTYPIVLIAEARPPTQQDKIIIRLADRGCVRIHDDDMSPELDLAELPQHEISYSSVFTPDGRIMTRITSERAAILHTMGAI